VASTTPVNVAGGAASDDVLDGAFGDQAAAADDDEPVGGQGHLAHEVAGDQDRAAFGGEGAQQLADPLDALGVEAVDRFVEEQSRRVAQQRRGDAEALAHPEGEPAGPAVRHVGQADLLEDVVGPPAVDAVGVGEPAQVVPGAAARVDGLGLEEGAYVAQGEPEVPVRVAVDGDPARGGGVEAHHHPHGCRLPGPVGAEEAGDFAGSYLEAEIVDGHGRPVALGDVGELDHRIRRGPGRRGGRTRRRRSQRPVGSGTP
jgi:hypothetical protein